MIITINNDDGTTNFDVNNISDEIKNNINDIYSKLEQLYNFNINTKYSYEDKNYNEISDYLTEINITCPTCACEIYDQTGENPIEVYLKKHE